MLRLRVRLQCAVSSVGCRVGRSGPLPMTHSPPNGCPRSIHVESPKRKRRPTGNRGPPRKRYIVRIARPWSSPDSFGTMQAEWQWKPSSGGPPLVVCRCNVSWHHRTLLAIQRPCAWSAPAHPTSTRYPSLTSSG